MYDARFRVVQTDDYGRVSEENISDSIVFSYLLKRCELDELTASRLIGNVEETGVAETLRYRTALGGEGTLVVEPC